MARTKKVCKTKNCPRCGAVFYTANGDKYCDECEKVVKAELKASGFLQKTAGPCGLWGRRARSEDQRQAYDKESSPWSENAVRALEGD
jgi:uncharacterized Zn finger protein (UPF0148 family)